MNSTPDTFIFVYLFMSLCPAILKRAYSQGLFPMEEDGTLYWVRPEKRALLPIEGIHVSRSLARTLRKGSFTITFDQAFEEVVKGCRDRPDTWIGDGFLEAYLDCHRQGWGHSCEAWFEGELVGGLYGLAVGGVFCAESKFSRRTDASKAALKAMVDHCRGLGFALFDIQILNPHTASLGGYEVGGRRYLRWLSSHLDTKTPWSWTPDQGWD